MAGQCGTVNLPPHGDSIKPNWISSGELGGKSYMAHDEINTINLFSKLKYESFQGWGGG